MKRLLVLAMVMTLLIVNAVPAIAAPPLHRATGGGTLVFPGWGQETYGFTATQLDADGNAKGNMQLVWHYEIYPGAVSPLVMHADVLYLAVDADTGDAWIGGIITKSNDYGWVGAEFYIQVRDVGEGSKASGPDMIGYTCFGPGWAIKALNMWDGDLFEFTNGNVQVK